MTVGELAAALGCDRRTISRYRRNGMPLIDLPTALRWIDANVSRRGPVRGRKSVKMPPLNLHALGADVALVKRLLREHGIQMRQPPRQGL